VKRDPDATDGVVLLARGGAAPSDAPWSPAEQRAMESAFNAALRCLSPVDRARAQAEAMKAALRAIRGDAGGEPDAMGSVDARIAESVRTERERAASIAMSVANEWARGEHARAEPIATTMHVIGACERIADEIRAGEVWTAKD
jgi:hypothetical protein